MDGFLFLFVGFVWTEMMILVTYIHLSCYDDLFSFRVASQSVDTHLRVSLRTQRSKENKLAKLLWKPHVVKSDFVTSDLGRPVENSWCFVGKFRFWAINL